MDLIQRAAERLKRNGDLSLVERAANRLSAVKAAETIPADDPPQDQAGTRDLAESAAADDAPIRVEVWADKDDDDAPPAPAVPALTAPAHLPADAALTAPFNGAPITPVTA